MVEFLRLLDAELKAPITVTVVGGAAIGPQYDTRHATTDIDLTHLQAVGGHADATSRSRQGAVNSVDGRGGEG